MNKYSYDIICKCMDNIKTPVIYESIRHIIMNLVPDKTYDKPASSTGKYHPYETRNISGIAVHTRYVVNTALVLMSADPYYDDNQLHKDYIIAACILHDSCKYGIDSEELHTTYEHPDICYTLIKDYAKTRAHSVRRHLNYIAKLIRSHHGRWGSFKCNTKDKQIVHLADLIAAKIHVIESRPEVPDNILSIMTNAFDRIGNTGLGPEVMTYALANHYRYPDMSLEDCINVGLNEWVK